MFSGEIGRKEGYKSLSTVQQTECRENDIITTLEKGVTEIETFTQIPLTNKTLQAFQTQIQACISKIEKKLPKARKTTRYQTALMKTKEDLLQRVTKATETILEKILEKDFSSSAILNNVSVFFIILQHQHSPFLSDAKFARKALRKTLDVLDFFDNRLLVYDNDLSILDDVLHSPESITQTLFNQLSQEIKDDEEIMRNVFLKEPTLFQFITDSSSEKSWTIIESVIKDNPRIVQYVKDSDSKTCELLAKILIHFPKVFQYLSDDQKYKKNLLKNIVAFDLRNLTEKSKKAINEIIIEIFEHLDKADTDDYEFVASVLIHIPELFNSLSSNQNHSLLLLHALINRFSKVPKENKSLIQKILIDIFMNLDQQDTHNPFRVADILKIAPELFEHLSPVQKYKKEVLINLLDFPRDLEEQDKTSVKNIILDMFAHLEPQDKNNSHINAQVIRIVPHAFHLLTNDQKYHESLLDSLIFTISSADEQNGNSIKKIIVEIFNHLDLNHTARDKNKITVDVVQIDPEVLDRLSVSQKYNKIFLESLLLSRASLHDETDDILQKGIIDIFHHINQWEEKDAELIALTIIHAPEIFHLISEKQKYTKTILKQLLIHKNEASTKNLKSVIQIVLEIVDTIDDFNSDDDDFLVSAVCNTPEVFDHISANLKYTGKFLDAFLVHYKLTGKNTVLSEKLRTYIVDIYDHMNQDTPDLLKDILRKNMKDSPNLCMLLFDKLPSSVREDERYMTELADLSLHFFSMIKKIHDNSCLRNNTPFLAHVYVNFYKKVLKENLLSNQKMLDIFKDPFWDPLKNSIYSIIDTGHCDKDKEILSIMRILPFSWYKQFFSLTIEDYSAFLVSLSEYTIPWPILNNETSKEAMEHAIQSNNRFMIQRLITASDYTQLKMYVHLFIEKHLLHEIDLVGKEGFLFDRLQSKEVHENNSYFHEAFEKGFHDIALHIAAFSFPDIEDVGRSLLLSLKSEELIDLIILTQNHTLIEFLKEPLHETNEKMETIVREKFMKNTSLQEREHVFDGALSIYSIPELLLHTGYMLFQSLPTPEPTPFDPLIEEVKPFLESYVKENMISLDECLSLLNRYIARAQELNLHDAYKALKKVSTPTLSAIDKEAIIKTFISTCEDTIGIYDELLILDELNKNEAGKKLIDSYLQVYNKDFAYLKGNLSLFCKKASLATKGLPGGNLEFFKKARKKLYGLMVTFKEKNDPDATWYAIKDFVEASSHCIGAYDDAIRIHYDKARAPKRNLTPKELLEMELAKMRSDFLVQAALKQNPDVALNMEVHQHTKAIIDLSEELGIIGALDEKHEDIYTPKGYNKEMIKAIFLSQYFTPGKIIRNFIDTIRESSSLRRDCFYRLIAEKSDYLNDPDCKEIRDTAYQELEKWQRGEANTLSDTLTFLNLEEKKKLLEQPPNESLVKTLREEIAFRIWYGIHVCDYEQDGVLKVTPDLLFTMRDLFESLGIITLPAATIEIRNVEVG